MGNKFSKSLFGYSKKEVNMVLENMDNEFDLTIKEYTQKESELKKENIKLISELNELNEKMKDDNYLDDKLSEILYNSHINSINKIYNAEKKFEEMINYKNEIIKNLEGKNEKINSDIRHLMDRINELINN